MVTSSRQRFGEAMDRNAEIAEEKHQRLVTSLKRAQFFGILETHFEEGRIVRIKRHETLLDKDLDHLTHK